MPAKPHLIEVDETTSAALNERAAARGLSVSELIAVLLDDTSTALDVDAEQIAEFDRRWVIHQTKSAGVAHGKVVRWLETWGTPAFRPWPGQ